MTSTRKVLVTFGTRPEAIKLAPVLHELKTEPYTFQTLICSTGQHEQLLEPMLRFFGVVPHYSLRVMQEDQSLNNLASRLLGQLGALLVDVKPDLVMVQGDTTTALMAALSAYHSKIPVAHVEAGLRTSNRYSPFPEEANRRLVDQLSAIHFAPTEAARQNLLREGFTANNIHVTGNTVIDALAIALQRPAPVPDILAHIPQRRVLLVTMHRRENFGPPMERICQALLQVVDRNSDVAVVFPVHRNPHCRATVFKWLSNRERIHLLQPLGYPAFVHLMAKSYLILTDSGGIQEEAPTLGVPVLVLRQLTERPEAVVAGAAQVVGTEVEGIVSNVERLMVKSEYARMALTRSPFGDGTAAKRIVAALVEAFAAPTCVPIDGVA